MVGGFVTKTGKCYKNKYTLQYRLGNVQVELKCTIISPGKGQKLPQKITKIKLQTYIKTHKKL